MSQEKVDKYKEQKANRQKIMKREKRILRLEKAAAGLVALIAVCWIGYSAYGLITEDGSESGVETTEIDVSALSDYLVSLSEEE